MKKLVLVLGGLAIVAAIAARLTAPGAKPLTHKIPPPPPAAIYQYSFPNKNNILVHLSDFKNKILVVCFYGFY